MNTIIHTSKGQACPRSIRTSTPAIRVFQIRRRGRCCAGNQCTVAFYDPAPPENPVIRITITLADEEIFYIISGSGVCKTPEGEKPVKGWRCAHLPALSEWRAQADKHLGDRDNSQYLGHRYRQVARGVRLSGFRQNRRFRRGPARTLHEGQHRRLLRRGIIIGPGGCRPPGNFIA